MEEITLNVQTRSEVGYRKLKAVRRNHFIPAIVYGEKKKAAPIKVDRKIFQKLERQHKGENIILQLELMDGDKKIGSHLALIKEIQHDPVSDEILHIDFHRISLTQEIEVKIPIVAKGEAVGVKLDGGALDHLLWELNVVCLPTNIPQRLEVDVSHLKIQDSVYVKDIVLPEGVKTKHNLDSIVFTVVPPMKEITPEAAAEAAAPTEVEVIKEKKEEVKEKEPAEGPAKEKAEGKEKEKEKEKEGK